MLQRLIKTSSFGSSTGRRSENSRLSSAGMRTCSASHFSRWKKTLSEGGGTSTGWSLAVGREGCMGDGTGLPTREREMNAHEAGRETLHWLCLWASLMCWGWAEGPTSLRSSNLQERLLCGNYSVIDRLMYFIEGPYYVSNCLFCEMLCNSVCGQCHLPNQAMMQK